MKINEGEIVKREFISDDNEETNNKLIALLKAVPVRDLIMNALRAREHAYCPYSKFAVGAALLTKDNKVFLGSNIENASYGVTNCAERTAFYKALSDGYNNFRAIAIIGGPEGKDIKDFAFPCGTCRQVMMEFCSPEDFVVIVAKSESVYKVYALKELLPEGFGPSNLNKK